MKASKVCRFFVAVLLAGILSAGAAAQTQFGTISGRVTDNSGAVIPDAKITLTNTATNARQEVSTNGDGLYVLANVSAGSYELTIEKANFKKVSRKVTVEVAQRLGLDFSLVVGAITETVTVTEQAVAVNTLSGDLSRTITQQEVSVLPMLSRNPYSLMELSAGAVVTRGVVGDARGGVAGDNTSGGVAINGARTSSVNYLLDGGDNNATFATGAAQTVPLDAVQEFRVQTNSMTAEFGRNAVVTNVVTKSGSNTFHGSLYEYYRGSALATASFDDNANGRQKSRFNRNQFGGSAGGPIISDKTFYFASLEGTRVRGGGTASFFVPTQNFITNTTPNAANFISAFGGLPASNCVDRALTAADIWDDTEGNRALNGASTYALPGNGLFNGVSGALIPATTQLFCRTTIPNTVDNGGGVPQNTWLMTARIDHNFSNRTSLQGRYAFTDLKLANGAVSISPFDGFNTPLVARNQNLNLTLTHSFTTSLFGESRVMYGRNNQDQPLGAAPGSVPCWVYNNQTSTPTTDAIVFPGYLPAACVGFSIPSGGPKNNYQFFQGMTLAHGAHTFKWGGQYMHIRDNHTFGAFQNHTNLAFTMQSMLNGNVDFIAGAIDPKGKFPGELYTPATDGPFVAPQFGRHFRYNEWSFYGEDSWKMTPRFTATLGMRWEYFGVLHSPNAERNLDANLYLNAVGNITPGKSIFEQVRDARFSRTNNFFNQDFDNFAPRVGLAWDVLGTGRTVVRAGYGMFYDRNFGNALFNAIQNFPNYAVINVANPGVPLPVDVNQFNTLGALLAGGSLNLSGSGRMLNREMVTAYSQQWNLTVEHDIFGKGIIGSLSYVGTKGDKLYSLNNLNQRGSCLLLAVAVPGSPCNPAGGNSSRINQSGLTGMNRRGNEGLSRYHGLSFDVRTRQIGRTGLTLTSNYSWSHAIDNSSSFFGDSAFEAVFGFGFRDPYNPAADRSDSSNDIRHRFVASWNWAIPFAKDRSDFVGTAFGNWSISGIFQAQTGGAFTVYDGSPASQCSLSGPTNFCAPVLTGAVPARTDITASGTANTFTLYNLANTFQTQDAFCAANTLGGLGGAGCTAVLINQRTDLLAPRNLFRTPGVWNMDVALLKDFRTPWERSKVQFRAEFFNLFNHSNLYAVATQNQFNGAASTILGKRGLRNDASIERRNIQLALRFNW